MEGPRISKSRVGTLSKTACVGCRRLKMKCVWTSGQPCLRCQKTKRRCVFATPSSQHRTASTSIYAQTDAQTQAQTIVYRTTDLDRTLEIPFTSTSHDNASHVAERPSTSWRLVPVPIIPPFSSPEQNLGDFYPSSTPLPTVPARDTLWSQSTLNHGPNSTLVSPRTPSRFGDTSALQVGLGLMKPTSSNSHDGQSDLGRAANTNLPTDEEMSHLCRFFHANLLVHIPILAEHDVGDYVAMVKKKRRLLASAMVYVAARYVPGCKAIQRMLLPDIMAILEPLPKGCDEDTRWTTLQACAVLYNWASPLDIDAHGDSDSFEPLLKYDTLRNAMETLTQQCSLHKAAEELAITLEQGRNDADMRQTSAFRRYLFWLWLFGITHFRSLLAREPTRMQPDASIRASTRLLRGRTHDDQVRQILAKVELCLVWTQPIHREWWCSMPHEDDAESALTVLKTMDEALENWRRTWLPTEQAPSDRDHPLHFQYYFSRFCASAYVSKLYQSSASARSSPLFSLSLISKATERASQSSRLFLDLRPLSKSAVRFRPEDTFAMLALGCHYVLCAHRLLVEVDMVKSSQLAIVRSVAELMVELGLDGKHSARIYAESLLASLPSQFPADHTSTPSLTASPFQQQGMQSPEAERIAGTGSLKSWAQSRSINLGSLESRALFESVAAVDEVWPSSLLSRSKHSAEPWLALCPPDERRTGTGQHSTTAAPNIAADNGLYFDYSGSGTQGYAPAGENISYAT